MIEFEEEYEYDGWHHTDDQLDEIRLRELEEKEMEQQNGESD